MMGAVHPEQPPFFSNRSTTKKKFVHLHIMNWKLLVIFLLISDFISSENLVERINREESGKGSVTVVHSKEIQERLGKLSDINGGDRNEKIVEVAGYRIQVFVGNDQRNSKNEAYTKEAEIKSLFPEFNTYVVFTAPFWRLKVGDFQSHQQAQQALQQLKVKFPLYGREMSIVKDRVKIRIKKND
jgi:hypothetical protein